MQSTILILALTLLGCASPPPAMTANDVAPTTVIFAASTDVNKVREALARALTSKGYLIESEQGSELVAAYNRKGRLVRVSVAYGADRAVLSYLTSSGLTREEYHRWMRKLEQRVRETLQEPPAAEPQVAVSAATPQPVTVLIEPARELSAVRDAVSHALVGRHYIIESEAGQRIVARYSHGDTTLRIAVEYAADRALISLVDSRELELEQYDGWMRGLQAKLLSQLAQPASTDVAEPAPAAPRKPEPVTVLVEPARDSNAVRALVSRALVARRYIVESATDGRITARYTHDEAFLRIAVDYASDRINVSFLESSDVELERYEGWMRGLQLTLQQEIQRKPG